MRIFQQLILVSIILSLISCNSNDFYIIPFKRYIIPQNGMYPGMPSKSTLWVKKKPLFSVEKISRGEIIVFRQKENGEIYDFIWRVIGLPGDSVRITGTSVYLNNTRLAHENQKETSDKIIFLEKIDSKEYFVAYDVQPDHSSRIDIDTVVPDKHFFLLGDNRDNAMDSRFKGFVSFDSVIGKKM